MLRRIPALILRSASIVSQSVCLTLLSVIVPFRTVHNETLYSISDKMSSGNLVKIPVPVAEMSVKPAIRMQPFAPAAAQRDSIAAENGASECKKRQISFARQANRFTNSACCDIIYEYAKKPISNPL